MSAPIRTATSHLSLVRPLAGEQDPTRGEERLSLRPSARLTKFAAAAAAAGIDPARAVCLGLERALALDDACDFRFDVEVARRRLNRAAAAARPAISLTPPQAAYVRTLSAPRPLPPADVEAGLTVALPGRVLTRARGGVAETALHAGAVPEMIAWEVAATLEGRTMGEWALRVLAATAARAA